MPGLDWDLNLDPDHQVPARRLSFSDAESVEPLRASSRMRSVLPPIAEDDSEGSEAEKPVHSSRRAGPQSSVPVTSSATLYSAQGGVTHPSSVHVTMSLVLAAPAPLQFQKQQEAVAAARTSEYQRQLQSSIQQQASASAAAWTSEYQGQLQALMQQQASASAAAKRARVRQLRLYTEARGPAGYETKWDELHPMSQRLLLRIEEKLGEYKYHSQQLDQCSPLHDPSLYNKSFELTASQTVQPAHCTTDECTSNNQCKCCIY